jgi:hypothetical protein
MQLFPPLVYVLCFGTSLLCAVLLTRSYLMSRSMLLLWSALCFSALAISNFLLILDLVVLKDVDLAIARSAATAVGVAALVFGQIWSSD